MTYSQENSNSYPKTVTGVIDFGKDTFTVFTQAQKKKVYEYILRYEDCSTNAIIDSIIIQNYRIKNTADTLAISLCRKDNAVKDIQINLMSGMLDNRNELIAEKDKEISTYIKQLKKEKRHKKLAVGLGTTAGFLVGGLIGILVSETYHLLGR